MAYLLGREETYKKQKITYISELFFPEQAGDKTSVWTVDGDSEVRLQEYIEESGMYIQGWIHSHPTFSAFLSSIDAHMQHGLQALNPRAIAVVTDGDDQAHVFRLNMLGMTTCKNCTASGDAAHKHERPNEDTS
eukprot:8763266-Alexandrium_andersonii.AAC.1